MRISGIEPSSVILRQTNYGLNWNVMPKYHHNKLKQKGMMWKKKPNNLNRFIT